MNAKEWYEQYKASRCNRCVHFKDVWDEYGGRYACGFPQPYAENECIWFEPDIDNCILEGADFESLVAIYLLNHNDYEDVPCAHGMKLFCPKPPFAGKLCGNWCRLRLAGIAVDEKYFQKKE